MEDSQREAMYNAWADSKKWMRVEIYKSFTTYNGSINEWRACAEHTFGCVERPTRILAIQKIQGMLAERGYEISNLSELFGVNTDSEVIKERVKAHEDSMGADKARKTDADKINDLIEHLKPKFEEKRLTFLEWCREIELQNNTVFYWQQGLPQHKLKDSSITDGKYSKQSAEMVKLFEDELKNLKESDRKIREHELKTAELRGYRKALNDIDRVRKVKIKMPEGKIEYKP